MEVNVRWLFLGFLLAVRFAAIGFAGTSTEDQGVEGNYLRSLEPVVKEGFLLNEAEWRLGECYLGFADVGHPAAFGPIVVGYWIFGDGEESTWLFRLSERENEVQMSVVQLLLPVYTDSPLERRARSGMLTCSELEAERGRLFEVLVVPPEKARKPGRDLLQELGRVQVPLSEGLTLHADHLDIFVAIGFANVLVRGLTPPPPSLSRWLHRFREVVLKHGVKKPYAEKPGSGSSKP